MTHSATRTLRNVASASVALLTGLACSSCTNGYAQTAELSEATPRKPITSNGEIAITPVAEHVVGKALVTSARVAFDENRLAHVFSPVTGRVTEIIAQLGQHVKIGERLAVIVSPDMGNAESDVNKARPAVIQADKMLKREKELFAAHADTQVNLEAAQATYDQAVAEEQRAEEKLRLLMEKAHTDRVQQTFPLLSPIDGEIVARQINPGAEVQGQYSGGATQELYTIGRQDALWILSDVYEQDLARVKLGATVEIRTVAYPDTPLTGKVDWISGTLDPVMRTATVRCTVTNTDDKKLLKAQMYATVAIDTEGRTTLAIPRSAILHFGSKTIVMAPDPVHPGQYEKRPVIVDEDETGDWVPVLHGLEKGENIVTSGALLLSETID